MGRCVGLCLGDDHLWYLDCFDNCYCSENIKNILIFVGLYSNIDNMYFPSICFNFDTNDILSLINTILIIKYCFNI